MFLYRHGLNQFQRSQIQLALKIPGSLPRCPIVETGLLQKYQPLLVFAGSEVSLFFQASLTTTQAAHWFFQLLLSNTGLFIHSTNVYYTSQGITSGATGGYVNFEIPIKMTKLYCCVDPRVQVRFPQNRVYFAGTQYGVRTCCRGKFLRAVREYTEVQRVSKNSYNLSINHVVDTILCFLFHLVQWS